MRPTNKHSDYNANRGASKPEVSAKVHLRRSYLSCRHNEHKRVGVGKKCASRAFAPLALRRRPDRPISQPAVEMATE